MSLSARIMVGMGLGVAAGLFFGESMAALQVIGEVFVRLLQMTVLPYVTISLVTKIGRLSFDQAKTLAGRAGLVLVALWVISLATVVLMPLSLPDWNAGSFFSKRDGLAFKRPFRRLWSEVRLTVGPTLAPEGVTAQGLAERVAQLGGWAPPDPDGTAVVTPDAPAD